MTQAYTFEQFKQDALRTESKPDRINLNPALFVAALQLGACVTEVGDLLKKTAFYGKPLDKEKLLDRLVGVGVLSGLLLDNLADIDNVEADVVGLKRRVNEGESEEVKLTPESFPVRLTHGLLGNFTEAGELLTALLTSMMTGEEIDKVIIGEEFADQDWYKAITFDTLGLSEDATRQAVINKLRVRYPEKFSNEQAENRDLEAERAQLESGIN